MRILFLTSEFPSPWEPTKATFNLDMVQVTAPGNDWRVVSPVSWLDEHRSKCRDVAPGESLRHRSVGGVDVRYPRYYYTPGVFRSCYGAFYQASIRQAVREATTEWSPDVVLSYWAHPDGYVARRVARQLRVPFVLISGGSDVLLLTGDKRRAALVRDVVLAADLVVTVSEHLRRTIVAMGADGPKVKVAYRGIDRLSFCPAPQSGARTRLGIAENCRMLLWVGRFVPVKAVDILLESLERIRVRMDAVVLYLVGDGPLRSELEHRSEKRGLSDHVKFVGSVEHGALPDWFRAADVTVLPSRSEGLPNVLLESIACGTPFVASEVGGISEIADPAHDRLVPPGGARELAEGIVELITRGPSRAPRRFVPASRSEFAVTIQECLSSVVAGGSPATFPPEASG